MFRSLGALIGDVLVVVLFVSIGLMQHGTPLTPENLFFVAWPFVVGLLLGHLAIRAWRAPFSLWPHGVFVWAITVAGAMALRTLVGLGTEISFVVVTAAVTGAAMLGWRAVAMYLTRGERRAVVPVPAAAPAAGADEAGTDEATAAEPTAPAPSDPAPSDRAPSDRATEDGTGTENEPRTDDSSENETEPRTRDGG